MCIFGKKHLSHTGYASSIIPHKIFIFYGITNVQITLYAVNIFIIKRKIRILLFFKFLIINDMLIITSSNAQTRITSHASSSNCVGSAHCIGLSKKAKNVNITIIITDTIFISFDKHPAFWDFTINNNIIRIQNIKIITYSLHNYNFHSAKAASIISLFSRILSP